MRLLLIAFVFVTPIRTNAEWAAPANPHPMLILRDAEDDALQARNDDALVKFQWLFRHGLDHDRAFYGVRLTGLLDSWRKLADTYPPAKKALEEARDESVRRLDDPKTAWDNFIDVREINRLLGEEDKTVAVFVDLDKKSPKIAQKVYAAAQASLVRAKKLELCNAYLDPETSYSDMAARHKRDRELADSEEAEDKKKEWRRAAEDTFTNHVALLVALLERNDRKDEAATIAKRAKMELNKDESGAQIDGALVGKLPTRWPSTNCLTRCQCLRQSKACAFRPPIGI
ncbi:MAG TPA: hypothetical protein VH107_01065 [Lacipirellulaceae bacterium]|jgi:transposase-like protein|nr:hypothetical protein [Lacipirellulaceae bacterium]